MNDGSTDLSNMILEEYANKDKRILIINKKNNGLSSARNTGLNYVTSEYLMFVDSDDWIDLDTCRKVHAVAKQYDADLVFWSYVREFSTQAKEKLLFWDNETVFSNDSVKINLQRRLCGLIGDELRHPDYANALETAWGKLYLSKKILKNKIKFVDTAKIGTEDVLFNIYVFEHIEKAVYIKKSYYHYRKDNSDSLTSRFKPLLFEQWQCLFNLIYDYIIDRELPDEFMQALQNRIALSMIGLGLNIVSAHEFFSDKIKRIEDILTDERYSRAFYALEVHYMPMHWKLFFWCTKMQNSWGIFILLIIMQKLI